MAGDAQSFWGAFENQGRISAEAYLQRFPDNRITGFKGYEDTGTAPGRFHYRLEPSPLLREYRKRLVIDWGLGRRWDQGRLDKEVVEIRSHGYADSFVDYHDVRLRFADLKTIINHPQQNRRWQEKLSSIKAVYLILDEETGVQYVGCAHGKDGLWGRWKTYADTDGHGHNKHLVDLIQRKPNAGQRFVFSILRTFDMNALEGRVLDAEVGMKRSLGSRVWGYNA